MNFLSFIHCSDSRSSSDGHIAPHRLVAVTLHGSPNEQPHFDYFPPLLVLCPISHRGVRGGGDPCAIGDSEVPSPFLVIFIRVNQLCVDGRRLRLRAPPHPDAPSAKRKNQHGPGLALVCREGGLGNVCIRQCIVSGWVVRGGGRLCESN